MIPHVTSRMMRLWASALAVLGFCATAALCGPKDKRLDIYWVDVEGGAPTLIVTPAGSGMTPSPAPPGRV